MSTYLYEVSLQYAGEEVTQKCRGCYTHFAPDDIEQLPISRLSKETVPYCTSCVPNKIGKCKDCSGLYNKGSMSSDGKKRVCTDCYDDGKYFSCPSCNMIHPGTELRNDGSGPICKGCAAPRKELKSPLVLDGDFGVKPVFHGDKEGRYLGTELEVMLGKKSPRWLHDVAAESLDRLNGKPTKGLEAYKHDTPFGRNPGTFAFLKNDPSLDKDVREGKGKAGFEIITHPATLDVHKEKWDKFLIDPPKGLIKGGADSEGWGLHVHIDKSKLSELQIGKMLMFVNSHSNKKFIEHMAGRDPHVWGRLDPSKKLDDAKKKNKNRYEAINLRNPKTVEFRIFKGTLDKHTFLSRLEFCDALTEFSKDEHDLPLHEQVHDTGKFFAFVDENKKHYPYLAQTIEKYQNASKS